MYFAKASGVSCTAGRHRVITSAGFQITMCGSAHSQSNSQLRAARTLPSLSQLQGAVLCSSPPKSSQQRSRRQVSIRAAETKAFIWDCDGVILESEEWHRLAYNASFEHFDARENGEGGPTVWSVEYYDKLQNTVGGGKPKMRYHFDRSGWPTTTIIPSIPMSEDEKTKVVDELQAWKTTHYQTLVANDATARPNVLRLFDEAKNLGLKLAVCSAATKSSAVAVVENLLGMDRYQGLDVFMAGDDVPNKKPDPSIYLIAAERMGLDPSECLVIEDSTVGVKAARAAGMRVIVTYTHSTADQKFEGAERIMSHIKDDVKMVDLLECRERSDDRPDFQDV